MYENWKKKIIDKCHWGDFEGVFICDFENISSGSVEWLLFFEVLLNHVFAFRLDTWSTNVSIIRNQPIDSQLMYTANKLAGLLQWVNADWLSLKIKWIC